MNAFARLGAGLAASCVLAAQGQTDPAQLELARMQRQLQQNRAEVDRLIDMRLRHDLGLPGEEDGSQFRPDAPVTTATIERSQQELREEDAATASLLERYNKLRVAADQLRTEAAARAGAERQERSFVVVPQAGVAQPSRPRPVDPGQAVAGPLPAPAGEQRPPKTAGEDFASLLGLDPVKSQIQGSTDHLRVAQALFKAGQVLMDRAAAARERGRPEMAREFDDRGKERLARSLEELTPLLQRPQPLFQALFCQGRCRELLFRYAERYEDLSPVKSTRDYQRREQEVREPFLSISARDVTKQGARGEVEVMGPWGMAAQTAMEQFRWMNLHGNYDARATIDALTWPGEHDQ
ncbi:MAG TPA: hypothetical protein VFZ65_09140 [Planctomycetota bacterium]|nr:hypothetical protein [Planctomycetota bacterium]